MAPPPKKRRIFENESHINGNPLSVPKIYPNDPLEPVTAEDKRQWQGFCEIESEPAFFNVMLKDFGVKGVKVQEVLGLDDELLAMLPQPVYGLIFLFRYRSSDQQKQEEASCPDNVWFANQTQDFACATVSLLNIVNNIPDIDIGEHLQSFKRFTKEFTPAMRGDQIGSFEFVKQIHNSFARKMDMLCIDLGMETAYDNRRKVSKKTTSKKKKTVADDGYIDDDAAFHFIAFVPIDGDVWGLDGLNRQPVKLGLYDTGVDWLSVIAPVLQARIAEYAEGQIEFSLLSLIRDPLLEQRAELAMNTNSIRAVEERLEFLNPDWKVFAGAMDDALVSPNEHNTTAKVSGHHLEQSVDEATIPSSVIEKLSLDCPAKLMAVREELITSQRNVRQMIQEEESSTRDDERRARERRQDYGPVIHTWLKMLAEKEGVVKDLIEASR